jgi:hypothetical protein
MKSITTNTCKRTSIQTGAYCINAKKSDFIEVTEWTNGEGKDILISSNNKEERMSLTYGEWQALCVAFNYVEKQL